MSVKDSKGNELNVGDNFVVINEFLRKGGFTKIYTVSEVSPGRGVVFVTHKGVEGLVCSAEIEKYTEPKKHIHYDLIVAWANDPENVIIQWYEQFDGTWLNCHENNPSWSEPLQYRIKPKTKQVTRWKWVVKCLDGGLAATGSAYTEEEIKIHFKPIQKIDSTAVTTEDEDV